MLKAIIVDDEYSCCEVLKIRLEKYKDDIEVVAIENNIIDAEDKINELQPDVVFLDVQMPNGSGFDLLSQFPNPSFDIVFVTAYNEYAIKALKMSALDYLLKPIDAEDLNFCMEKLKSKNRQININKLKILQTNIGNNNELYRLVIPLVNGFEVVDIADVIYCQAESNYTKFFLKNNSEYLVCKGLKEFEEILSELFFFRIHNSYLINLNHIKGYTKGKSGNVIMSNGSALNISRQKKKEFLDLFFK